jgi:predicted ATP-grasp superfamily ATP-dependent carboligase
MRLFIYELISAGGLGDDVPASLRREGAAMLSAIVEDFERIPEVNVITLLSDRFDRSIGRHCQRTSVADEAAWFRRIAVDADAALIVAPEFDDLLARRIGWAVDAGCRLLGCNHEAIRLASDKYKLAKCWRSRGVPAPSTAIVSETTAVPTATWRQVLKPRFGAGSQATFLIQPGDDWQSALAEARKEWPAGDFVVQSYCVGQPVSVTLLIGTIQTIVTPGATQQLSDDGRFRYLGGRTPLPARLRARAIALARRAAECVPGLKGYVGVDLILDEVDDGKNDIAVEINPRLTTSYIGLRKLTRTNLAEVWLYLWKSERVDEPEWSEEAIEFTADGRTWLAV